MILLKIPLGKPYCPCLIDSKGLTSLRHSTVVPFLLELFCGAISTALKKYSNKINAFLYLFPTAAINSCQKQHDTTLSSQLARNSQASTSQYQWHCLQIYSFSLFSLLSLSAVVEVVQCQEFRWPFRPSKSIVSRHQDLTPLHLRCPPKAQCVLLRRMLKNINFPWVCQKPGEEQKEQKDKRITPTVWKTVWLCCVFHVGSQLDQTQSLKWVLWARKVPFFSQDCQQERLRIHNGAEQAVFPTEHQHHPGHVFCHSFSWIWVSFAWYGACFVLDSGRKQYW